jgi:23S rRNA pseudouridine1911/1915/1917 synthase
VVQQEGGKKVSDYNGVEFIYEDNHLLVVKKPKNILTQKDITNDTDMSEILKKYLKEKYNKPGNVFLGIVHRLDRPVQGVMVFAKTSKSASRLSDQIRKNEFKKYYLAIVNGSVKNKKGMIKDYLYKDKNKNIVKVVDKIFENSKEAILNYNVLDKKNNISLLQIELITGRSHQIRVQLSNMGHPLLGDRKYGQFKTRYDELYLLANKISFYHPTTKKIMNFSVWPKKYNLWSMFDYFKDL